MKSILIPTDFSELANRAAQYAVALFPDQIIQFTLVNAIEKRPNVLLQKEQEEQKQHILSKLEAKNTELRKQSGTEHHQFQAYAQTGSLPDILNNQIVKHPIDLIVMGTHGANKGLDSMLGSNTTEVLEKVDCPLLVIPEQASFKGIQTIIFALDYEEFSAVHRLYVLRYLSALHNSKLVFLHVSDRAEKPSMEKRDKLVLEQYFRNQEYEFKLAMSNSLLDGIQEHSIDSNAGMMVMVNRSHNLLHKFLNRSQSREMALSAEIPLLVFHDAE